LSLIFLGGGKKKKEGDLCGSLSFRIRAFSGGKKGEKEERVAKSGARFSPPCPSEASIKKRERKRRKRKGRPIAGVPIELTAFPVGVTTLSRKEERRNERISNPLKSQRDFS